MKHMLTTVFLAATALSSAALAVEEPIALRPVPLPAIPAAPVPSGLAEPIAVDAPAEVPSFNVQLTGIPDGSRIPAKNAYCQIDGRGKTRQGENVSPELSWHGAPEATKSFAILVVDPDVPADFSKANKDGQEIPENAPRQNFYHWAALDIPSSLGKIPAGKAGNGVYEGGQTTGKKDYGITGTNDFLKVQGGGMHGGYEGPCPPWNDKRLHHYYFRVYALDVPTLKPPFHFDGAKLEKAMKTHVIGMGQTMGTYSTNLDVLDSK